MSRAGLRRQHLVTDVVTLRGPLSAGAVAVAVEHVAGLLRRDGRVQVVVEDCDLSVVDAVSRMRLVAKRCGADLLLVGDRTLFAACGLDP